VRCPSCSAFDDKVVDSRLADEGSAIRRRRECLVCGRRYTTYERLEEAPVVVLKRSGQREPFDRQKILDGLRAACKNRPVAADALEALVAEVEEEVRIDGYELTSERIGLCVLDRLRLLDDVGYLRFASVYKGFDDVGDFAREARLLTKATAPKQRR
jgi:transcriptional repressor NrdR